MANLVSIKMEITEKMPTMEGLARIYPVKQQAFCDM
jgi:hypothetical protein